LDSELCGVGYLVASEIAYLDFKSLQPGETVSASKFLPVNVLEIRKRHQRLRLSYLTVIGGSKVSTKLPVIKGLLNQVDTLVLGGGLAFTFAKAQGIPIGSSLCEETMIDTAKELIKEAEEKGKKMYLPIDVVCAPGFPKEPMKLEDTKTFDMIPGAGIEDGWMGLDVGPKTIALFREALKGSSKIIFNGKLLWRRRKHFGIFPVRCAYVLCHDILPSPGPMGVFEVTPFDEGTKALVDVIEDCTKAGSISVVGGGDSVAALELFGKTKAVSYVSTGGGATLELLAGDELPGVTAIGDVPI
jgi:3-phosphoglycerate kinase